MSVVVSLTGFFPPARYDGVTWGSAEIQEAVGPAGPWTAIDTIAFPADIDPSHPISRNFTTANGTIDQGWYRVVFHDGTGAVSEPSDPVRNGPAGESLPPSPEDVRNGSPLLREKFPLPTTDPFQMVDLRNLVYQAVALVQANTWRVIDSTLGCPAPEGFQCETVPAALVPVAINAVTRMTERLKVTTDPALAEQVATGRRLRGFSAGPYSESYFAPGEFARRGAQQSRPAMDPDDALDAALWALATEDARDYFVWRATGQALPAGVAAAFDYRRESLGYSGAFGLSGGYGRGGPDGF